MGTKRTPLNRAVKHKITPELLAKFIVAREIQDADDNDRWEEANGRRREYLDLLGDIDKALQRAPWQLSPLNVTPGDRVAKMATLRDRDYEGAVEIRQALDHYAQGGQ